MRINRIDYPQCPNCDSSKDVILKFPKVRGFDIYFCTRCQNGFTHPVPRNIATYYHSNYWISPGVLGKTKNLIFNLFHSRRKNLLLKYLAKGDILEIGAGEGNFLKSLGSNFVSSGIEFPTAKIKNKEIIKVDFLNWKTGKKFDAIIFWESLEHLAKPQDFLDKSYRFLKNDGLIFIELPRFGCLESQIFGSHWFHLDPPRHLVHLTDSGLKKLLSRSGFQIIYQKGVLSYEYSVWGFVESVLNFFGIKSTDYFKRSKFPYFFILLFPLLGIAFFAETLFFFLGQSPIKLIVAKKKNV